MASRTKSTSAEGKVIAKGKTKEIRATNKPDEIEIYALDDLTAGNGAKHDVLKGKGELATTTTSNVFEFLKTQKGLRIAYLERTGPRTFLALNCEMIPLEIVIRAESAGSYPKHNPSVPIGMRFKEPIVEYYLKTKGLAWVGKDEIKHTLPVDDPLLSFDFEKGAFGVHDPRAQVDLNNPLFMVPFEDVGINDSDIAEIDEIALKVFGSLERGLMKAGKARLKDLKIELGWYKKKLYLADVIDNDSWRLDVGGREVSKENYRQGAPLASVLKDYQLVAKLTEGLARNGNKTK